MQQALKLNNWNNGYIHLYQNIFGELKPIQTIEYDNLINASIDYSNCYDVFESQNTFKDSSKRTEENLLQLRKFYIDLDNVEDINKTIDKINKLVEKKKLPIPTQIIFSGRGLHVKWDIKDYAASKKNLEIWKKTEDYFYKTLKPYGADPKAKDPCRILRVVGSINSKSDLQVKELVHNEIEPYDLYNVYNEYLPYLKTKKTKKKKIRQLPTKNIFTLNTLKLEDFKTLVKLRNGDVLGFRNCLIMLYSFHYRLENAITVEELISVTRAFNSLFNEPLKVSEVKSTCRSCNRRAKDFINGDKTKAPMKTSNIIESLEITEEEQKQLNVLISTNVKNYRKKESNKTNRRNEEGLTAREQQKQDTIKAIKELKKQGLNNTEIAKKLEMNVRSIRRIVKDFISGDTTKAPMKTSNIIENLAIIEEKQKQLKVLLPTNVKNYRKKESNKTNRKNEEILTTFTRT